MSERLEEERKATQMWRSGYEMKSLGFLWDAQRGCHDFWPFELCILKQLNVETGPRGSRTYKGYTKSPGV